MKKRKINVITPEISYESKRKYSRKEKKYIETQVRKVKYLKKEYEGEQAFLKVVDMIREFCSYVKNEERGKPWIHWTPHK